MFSSPIGIAVLVIWAIVIVGIIGIGISGIKNLRKRNYTK